MNENRLVQRLISLFSSHNVPSDENPVQPKSVLIEQHENAGLLLVEIVRVSRDAQITSTPNTMFHNPLLATAESPDVILVSIHTYTLVI